MYEIDKRLNLTTLTFRPAVENNLCNVTGRIWWTKEVFFCLTTNEYQAQINLKKKREKDTHKAKINIKKYNCVIWKEGCEGKEEKGKLISKQCIVYAATISARDDVTSDLQIYSSSVIIINADKLYFIYFLFLAFASLDDRKVEKM